MLKEFRVTNFKNFSNELIIKLDSHKDYDYNKEVIKNNILTKIMIVGDNGWGKTNLGYALFDITKHLSNSYDLFDTIPYLSYDSISTLAVFTYTFFLYNKNITYHYVKDKFQKLVYEELKEENKVIFKYDHQFKRIQTNIKDIEIPVNESFKPTSIILILANTYNIRICKDIVEFVNRMVWLNPNKNKLYFSNVLKDISFFDKYDDLIRFLKEFDITINNLSLISTKEKHSIVIKSLTDIIQLDKVISPSVKSLIEYFYILMNILEPSLIYFDDFDIFLNYNSSFILFNKLLNLTNTQVFLTSNNTFLISNKYLRADCYYIIRNNQINSLDKLIPKVIRKTNNLQKLYLSYNIRNKSI